MSSRPLLVMGPEKWPMALLTAVKTKMIPMKIIASVKPRDQSVEGEMSP